jgi:hypothetical protein
VRIWSKIWPIETILINEIGFKKKLKVRVWSKIWPIETILINEIGYREEVESESMVSNMPI